MNKNMLRRVDIDLSDYPGFGAPTSAGGGGYRVERVRIPGVAIVGNDAADIPVITEIAAYAELSQGVAYLSIGEHAGYVALYGLEHMPPTITLE